MKCFYPGDVSLSRGFLQMRLFRFVVWGFAWCAVFELTPL